MGEPLDHRPQAARARGRDLAGLAGPTHDADCWTFDLDPDGSDPVLGIDRLKEAYDNRIPDYPRASRCPRWSRSSQAVVTNDFPWITHDFFFEWRDHHRPDAPDLWPDAVREEMEQVMQRVFTEVNNGVYRCGFAGSQEAYDEAYDRLWTAMDWLEERLTDRRYLMGDAITEADVRLFTTLARFDAVYHGHFKCNRNKLTEMPELWGYARDLFQTPELRGERSTSTRSRRTTTSSTPTSTRRRSSRRGRTRRPGSSPTAAAESAPGAPRDVVRRPRPRCRRQIRCNGGVGGGDPQAGALEGNPDREGGAPERVLGLLVEGVVPVLGQQRVAEPQDVDHGADEGRVAVARGALDQQQIRRWSVSTDATVKPGWSPGTRRTASR